MIQIQWTCKTFKELTLDGLYEILALRQDVFVVEQNCPYLDADGKDAQALHVCGYDHDNELVAYTRILPQGISYPNYHAIGRVVTSQKIRGKKKGRELMEVSIRYTQQLLTHGDIKISAQSHLQKYYSSLGFVSVGNEYEEDGIPHIAMILKYEV